MPTSIDCPCGTGRSYQECCGVYHKNPGTAPTAESLMRSRYSAFAVGDYSYINATQKLGDDKSLNESDADETSAQTRWTKLEIHSTEAGLIKDNTGTVTFSAHFMEGHHAGLLTERSMFEKMNGQWFYVSGDHEIHHNPPLKHSQATKAGRNAPCPCGSGKKFKKCCAAS